MPTARSRIHRTLISWYRAHARDFPWRRTRDPYVIMISEIMLQQTQADRVEHKLPVFLKRFPTAGALARARRSSVIRAWQGMGYNRRAVHLHNAAKAIADRGAFPDDMASLRALPGIGRYTASAIMCFAHGAEVPVVDVNIRRVLARLSKKRASFHDLPGEHDIWALAEKWLPAKNVYQWNQALMDIGARFCKVRSVECSACPLRTLCPSRATLSVLESPRTARRVSEPMHKEIPHRIWRGRIVHALRSRTFADVRALTKAIDPTCSALDVRVIETLVKKLERDGLVRRTGMRIALA